MKMNRRIECRSEGCNHEVLFKTAEGAFDERRGGNGLHHRHSNAIQVSPYCKHHTCVHFHGDERCVYKKPSHDSVCAIHARCPIADCTQARAQFLEPTFDSLSNAVPKYARFDVCSDHKCALQRCPGRRASTGTTYCQSHACQADGCSNLRQEQRNCCVEHQCKTKGCRTIVEGQFPYCVIHIKCQVNSCNEARHLSAKTNEYLAFCIDHVSCPIRQCTGLKTDRSRYCSNHTCRMRDCSKPAKCEPYCEEHRCAEPSCRNARSWASEPEDSGTFCPMHTCRVEECQAHVDELAIFCSAREHSYPPHPRFRKD
ncbi:hypothetical protein B0I37DRAFT_129918 [Chaetomium sp. MPI-CAGE-AT-0009]|nr:hypothetical protein B0I37DRAFT_129918 [Chaetomium sp. MPI-CAGE-AT-0009]